MNYFLFKIYIAPFDSTKFSNSDTCQTHELEHFFIPAILHLTQEIVLFFLG